jgi:preprotein translocase subunit SecA
MNKQREVIYAERRRVLEGQSLRDFFIETLRSKVSDAVDSGAPEEEHPTEWDLPAILDELQLVFPVKDHIAVAELERLDRAGMNERLSEIAIAAYEAKEAELTPEIMRMVESQYIMLPIIDRLWVDHLYIMDTLKAGIGLRGYGQKDPRVEYEKEAYEIFEDLKSNIADEAIKAVFSVRVERQEDEAEDLVHVPNLNGGASAPAPAPAFDPLPTGEIVPQAAPLIDPAAAERLLGPAPRSPMASVHTNREEAAAAAAKAQSAPEKVGRNELCPCGSGKKFKRCHGAAA